jgi:hypothetical protein
MKKIFFIVTMGILFSTGCTKLDEGIYDRQVASEFYATPEGINAALADLYSEIRGKDWFIGYAGTDRGWYDLNEVSTDEMMIPTRSTGDWDDGGIWRQIYLHQWTPGHPFMEGTWNWLYRGVFKTNLAVDLLTNAKADPSKIAEAKVYRAFLYFLLVDGWGNVPFYTQNTLTVDQIPQQERSKTYKWILEELTANVPLLVTDKGGQYYGRFNRWAGYALLAKVYLNGKVYSGTETDPLDGTKTNWDRAIQYSDSIILKGGFSLHPNYLSIFGDTNPGDESIMSIFIDANTAPRNIIGIRSLRAEQGSAEFGFSTWGGSTCHQDFYNKYEAGDIRRNQWILGAQPGGITYVKEISSLTNAGPFEGARNIKYKPVAPYNGNAASNDFVIYRYADVLLTKAECLVRKGQAAAAKTLMDELRTRAGLSAWPSNPTLDDVLDERGRELCWEGFRRQDQIRFGKFLLARDFKPASPAHVEVFPIPTSALNTNRKLVQNTGY